MTLDSSDFLRRPKWRYTVIKIWRHLDVKDDYVTLLEASPFVNSWWRHQRKHFPRYWSFVRGIHRSSVNSSHKGQWREALIFSLSCALNKRLSKQSWGWWFETPSRSLWRHCNENRRCGVKLLYMLYKKYAISKNATSKIMLKVNSYAWKNCK